jgi:hypothetical protein
MPYARVSTAERERALHELAHHLSVGRLDPAEFEELTTRAAAATHRSELAALLADLPGQAPRPSAEPPTGPVALIVALLAVLFAILIVCAIGVSALSGSWLWLLLIPAVPAAILLARRMR